MLGEGMTNRELAARLHLSHKTVERHVRNVLLRLRLRNRSEAAAYVARHREQLGPVPDHPTRITTGRRTGQRRRIEIFLHNLDGQLFITGMPRAGRTRDWIHNISADPRVAVHLKQSLVADVPATARIVTDLDERRPFIEAAARRWGRTDVLDMLRHSPLVVLTIDGRSSVG